MIWRAAYVEHIQPLCNLSSPNTEPLSTVLYSQHALNAFMCLYFVQTVLKAIMYQMYSKEQRWLPSAQLYVIIALPVKTLVKRCTHIAKHHPFTPVYFG